MKYEPVTLTNVFYSNWQSQELWFSPNMRVERNLFTEVLCIERRN